MFESGGLNPDSVEALDKAPEMYTQIRRRKQSTCENIAKNTGFSFFQCSLIWEYLFNMEHDLSDGRMRFHPDFAIADSWLRLSSKSGNGIRPYDVLMLQHELYEINLLIHNKALTQRQAHDLAEKVYNYDFAVKSWRNQHNGKL